MDIASIQTFYDSPLGKEIQTSLELSLAAILEDHKKHNVIVFGFPFSFSPILKNLIQKPVICQLSSMGTFAHPKLSTILAHDHNLPIRPHSFELAIVIHWLEFCDFPKESLLDMWRVLVPGGEIVLVYPNKRSFLPLSFKTPFGYGKSFSRTQIENLLVACSFTPIKILPALTGFPLRKSLILKPYKMLNFLNGVQISRGLKQELAPSLTNPFRWKGEMETTV